MAEVTVEIPESLSGERGSIKSELEELVSMAEKSRVLSSLANEIMRGAGQVPEQTLVSMGRKVKKGRFKLLKLRGLV